MIPRVPFSSTWSQNKQVNAFATLQTGSYVVNSGLYRDARERSPVGGHRRGTRSRTRPTNIHGGQQQYHKKARIGIALAGAVASAYGLGSLADVDHDGEWWGYLNGHQRGSWRISPIVFGLVYMVNNGL